MTTEVVNLAQKLSLFSDQWAPRVIAEMNDYQFKVTKLQGDFVWHSHAETDEAFLVLSGTLDIALRDRTVTLAEGELFVVPKGVEHRPRAEQECHVLIIEPRHVLNTGHELGERTAEPNVWI
jgi:mannose-6-phosphate isomerase-like protein (cupin superfamily)